MGFLLAGWAVTRPWRGRDDAEAAVILGRADVDAAPEGAVHVGEDQHEDGPEPQHEDRMQQGGLGGNANDLTNAPIRRTRMSLTVASAVW